MRKPRKIKGFRICKVFIKRVRQGCNSSALLNYYTLRDAQKLHFMQFRAAGLGIFAHSVQKHLAG